MNAWRSASVIGSAIGTSHDPKPGASGALRRASRQGTILERAQGRPRPPETGHQRAERNSERSRCLVIGEALDGDEVKRGALFLREVQEGSQDLLQADAGLLNRRRLRLEGAADIEGTGCLGGLAAPSVDEAVVEDREEPTTQVA